MDWAGASLRRVSLKAGVLGAIAALAAGAALAGSAEQRSNVFDDPFLQATHAIAACPPAEPPLLTATEARAQSHMRAEKGTTCHYYGRCRLPNAYLYDREIVPRVVRFIQLDDRFANTSIWILGQRRWVYLKGCVASAEQAAALVHEVRLIDDVEAVIDELMVGSDGKAPYDVARPAR